MRDISELIAELRERAEHSSDADAEFFAEVADALESRNDVIATFAAAKKMHDDNPFVKRYIKSWRARKGCNDLTYPSGDQVYRDYFTLCGQVKRITWCDGCLHWNAEKHLCNAFGPGHTYINSCVVPQDSRWCWRGPDHLIKAQENMRKESE